MAQDPLYEALGTRGEGAAPRPPSRRGRWIALLALLAAAGVVAVLTLHPHDRAGDPGVAVARIDTAPPPPPVVAPVAPAPAAAPPAPPANGDTVEIQHGVKVIRLGQASSSASVRVAVPEAGPTRLARAPDPRLVETSKFGPLPKIGSDGSRPADVYGRPSDAAGGDGRVALVLGGMGLDQMRTAQAGVRLSPAVTFGFPPDAPDLPAQVSEARSGGHEVVLQLPDATAADEVGLDRLHRAMAAFSGYAGVMLPASPNAGATQDIQGRGLYAIDGAAAPDAVTPDAATATTARKPDVVVGAADDPAAVAAALGRLAATARAKGSAVGLIPRADGAVAAVAAFVDGLAAQGLRLVPASALADQAKGATATAK